MGLNLKSIMKGKKSSAASGVMGVKKNTQTTDSIISEAVSNAGNISSMTMTKEEHDRIMSAKHKMPVQILVLKYFSLTLMSTAIIAGLLLKADLEPTNAYFSFLGLSENTGSDYVKNSQEKNIFEQKNTVLKEEIASITERSASFDESSEANKVSLLVPEILEVEALQRRWFNELVESTNENGQLVEKLEFGLVDSFADMIEYFEDKEYQPRFFNQKNLDQTLSASEPSVCNVANSKLNPADLKEKQKFENLGRCISNSTLIMANEISIRGLNINSTGANVTVSASDLLSRVFTLSSEFVIMMNSFDFFKGASITNFNRRELEEGGDTTEVALRLEFQDKDEEDEDDQYLVDLLQWQENWR